MTGTHSCAEATHIPPLPGSARRHRRARALKRHQSLRLQNLLDGVDVPLSMTRAELSTLCEGELGRVGGMVRACLEKGGVEAGSLAGVQALGGGCRMPAVQDAVVAEVRGEPRLRLQ